METKHTAGPWEWDEDILRAPSGPVIGVQVYRDGEHELMIESADRALIAAAPDLLAALKLVEWKFESDITGNNYCLVCENAQNVGHTPECPVGAAIAKAEGQQD